MPESVLKKRTRDAQWAEQKLAAAAQAKASGEKKREEIFKRAEKYVKEYRDQVSETKEECESMRQRRNANRNDGIHEASAWCGKRATDA